MDANLMGREVLCILDTRQIQRFMFRSNSMLDTLGGSDLMSHILEDAIRYSLHHIDPPLAECEYDLSDDPDAEIPYFTSSRIQVQQMICVAGNAMFIIRTGALAQKLIRKISRYYLEHAYSLNLTAAAVGKTENFGEDVSRLYQKLNAIKASSDTLEPIGTLPVAIRERRTGEPVIGFDEISGDPISESSRIRRQEARKRENLLSFQEICTTEGYDGKNYRAVIHADGNNLGITIGRILQATPNYEEAIRSRRRINRAIEECFERVMTHTMTELRRCYESVTGSIEGFYKEFQIIHRAGDDINCMCNARWVFLFLQFFYRNLEHSVIWKTETQELPLYVCTGIAIVTEEHDFHAAFRLAEECCASAKRAAKKEENLRNGLAGNWIDYQIMEQPNTQELDMLRERFYVTNEHISMLSRPYCMDREAEGEPWDYRKLMQRIGSLKTLSLSDVQRMILRQSYMIGTEEFRQWIVRFRRKNLDLVRLLGIPLYRDSDGVRHATWYDAVVLADFVMQNPEEMP